MDLYGLIGYPLGHSFSARFFEEKFRREGFDASYRNFELQDISELTDLLAKHPNLRGFNVTIPYKQQIIPYLTTLSPQARTIGAVNTVCVRRDSDGNVTALEGHNTDAPAFARTLAPLLPLNAVSALILGTGGASKAVKASLDALGIACRFVSRQPSAGQLEYSGITEDVMASHKLIVNTTPLGMSPKVDACPPIPYELLTSGHICYDLIYNPAQTLFMSRSVEMGATVKNGLDMLHLQALLAWKIWQS